ncbi:MAG TPA: endolytic transglycosylase MltG [Spirochaetes bacterium]|nr:endolytic transglycosylase MltG [Spirochaetota bacterium]
MGLNAPSLEGYLFPDTYIFPEESDSRDVIMAAYRRMRTVLDGLDLPNMKISGLSLHETLTLASLIEKEAQIPRERKYISAVFHNRLKRGMKLDCDPTVRYAARNFKGPITRSELDSLSPYNTYVHRGLPPTPICSPGKESILAAVNPAPVDFLYFVSRNDGSHYFSATLNEHNRAVRFYQRGVKSGFIDRQKL